MARSTKTSKQQKTKKLNPSKTVSIVTERFNTAWNYAKDNHHSRLERNWKLYNNMRWQPSYVGVTNTFVPMSYSIVETLTSALAAGRPSIDFTPQDMYKYTMSYYQMGKKPDLKALNTYFDYFWDCDNWDLKSIKTIRGGFRDGTAAEWVYWDGDKPRIMNMNIRDAIIDPNLTDPMQLITNPNDYYSGRRYLTTKAALEAEEIVDPESGELVKRFKNIDQIVPGKPPTGEEADKTHKEQMIGNVSNADDVVEVLEVWDGERIRSVAQRGIPIEDRENVLGIHCLVIHRFISDESTIYGKAILDVIAQSQELLNDVTNQSVDAVTDVLDPQYELDPQYADHLPTVAEAGPGTVFPFTPGSLRRVDKGTVNAQSFNERVNLKNEIREATGADQIVQGIAAQGQTTATEIQAQLNQAGQRFEIYVRMLEREGFYQRAKIVYAMMLHYIKEMQLIPTQSVDGPKFHVFDPSQFDDTYEPRIQLEATVRNSKMREMSQGLEQYQALIADPTNDLWEVKKIMYPKLFDFTEEELDRIIGAQKPQELEAAGPDAGMGAAPAEAPPQAPLPAGPLPGDVGVAA